MKVLQETTAWEGTTPNHIYITDDSKSRMLAYVQAGTKAVFRFSTPLRWDTRGRKFKEVANTFGFTEDTKDSNVKSWTVAGSKGNTYVVTLEENVYNCTCSGFQFRGTCRHIKGL
jgi:type V secretory pathway adhesin AidA